MIVHKLVKYEFQPGSFPQYRHYVECVCGFQSRLGTEQAAKSQFDEHLKYHGNEPYFANLKVEEQPKEAVQVTSPEEPQASIQESVVNGGGIKSVGDQVKS